MKHLQKITLLKEIEGATHNKQTTRNVMCIAY